MKYNIFYFVLIFNFINISCFNNNDLDDEENIIIDPDPIYAFPKVNDGGNQSKKIKFSTSNKPMCICKNELLKVNGYAYHKTNHNLKNKILYIYCDICKNNIHHKNSNYWHCIKKYAKEHKNGFDICNECVEIAKKNKK